MPFTTLGVASAVTPSVVETYFSHYFLNRDSLKNKPTAHISYHEGLRLIRQFLDYSSKHAVEDLQNFTAQWVPVPTWVRTVDVEVPPQFLTRSANVLKSQLRNLDKVGGGKWWQWRRSESALHAEWIEMKKDHNDRKRAGIKCDRVILYVHGGAYYFGSVDEHRYQMQRHARKLKARVLTPRYRLAPQFPFPCGLHDCIATYFYLLEHFEPSQILFAGDSAGGGMVLSMLVTLRDQGCPLPAGTILLSPWVDLAHSFPSVAGEGALDYIPSHGFHHKPSMIWPPPPGEDEAKHGAAARKFTQPVEQPFDVVELPANMDERMMSRTSSRDDVRAPPEPAKKKPVIPENQIPGLGPRLEITIDDKLVILREQIQLYTRNALLTHPLVSPVQQPSLGGLPPMLIQTGGGELLRDEQIYIAHKAANPRMYPPSEATMAEWDPQRTTLNQYPPTDVQLQVWDDLCHVPHTLSFTRPAKYMYRSVAQFGAWALSRAQQKGIEIPDDAVSIISNGSETDVDGDRPTTSSRNTPRKGDSFQVSTTGSLLESIGVVGKAGDELPPFRDHMIRQRVDRHGLLFPLPLASEIAALQMDPASIGAIKAGPVRKWLARRAQSEHKYASDYKKIAKKRAKEEKSGYDPVDPGESPPYTALVNRRRKGLVEGEKKKSKSWGLAMWTGWGSSHDENTIERAETMQMERTQSPTSRPGSRPGSSLASPTAPNGKAPMRGSPLKAEQQQHDGSNEGGLRVAGDLADVETKRERRRSSATVFSKTSSKKEKETDAYAAFKLASGLETKKVKDRGQAPAKGKGKSHMKASSSLDRNNVVSPVPETRRSGSTTAKPSMDTTPQSPIAQGRPPTKFETGKEVAVQVPGSENTYLDPESSRPHNGVSAYPFKLRTDVAGDIGKQASPNPSTVTLDSQVGVEEIQPFPVQKNRESTTPHMNGGMFTAPVELPTDVRSAQANAAGVTPGGPAGKPKAAADDPLDTVSSPASGRDRPVSIPSDDPALQYIRKLDTAGPIPSDPNTPVSPIDGSRAALEASSSTTSIPYNSKSQKQIRDSRLGNLGADGMPLNAFNWSASPAPMSESQAAAAANAVPVDANGQQTLFKVRNPVYDARANGAPEVVVPPVVDAPATAAAPAAAPAPFKMRHVIYDAKVAPPASRAAPEVNNHVVAEHFPAVPIKTNVVNTKDSTNMSPIRLEPVSPIEQQQQQQSPIPSAKAARPIPLTLDSDGTFRPAPPPKDVTHSPANGAGKQTQSPPRAAPAPVSRFSNEKAPVAGISPRGSSKTNTAAPLPPAPTSPPPTIGDFSFETEGKNTSANERPTLETFVTAKEGLGLEGEVEGRAF